MSKRTVRNEITERKFPLTCLFFLVMFNVIIRKRFFFLYTPIHIWRTNRKRERRECARRREIAIESERVTRRNRRGKVGYERRVRNNDQKEQREQRKVGAGCVGEFVFVWLDFFGVD
uniref:(northern house mosquito) hypothetical protein n=1 Tax=Culex pipiens TaxID=7175 RepID=A0A8D7ZXW0_CULPI